MTDEDFPHQVNDFIDTIDSLNIEEFGQENLTAFLTALLVTYDIPSQFVLGCLHHAILNAERFRAGRDEEKWKALFESLDAIEQ